MKTKHIPIIIFILLCLWAAISLLKINSINETSKQLNTTIMKDSIIKLQDTILMTGKITEVEIGKKYPYYSIRDKDNPFDKSNFNRNWALSSTEEFLLCRINDE